MKAYFNFFAISILLLILASCAKLLPSSKAMVKSRWQDFDSAKSEYAKIIPRKTTLQDLQKLGFNPYEEPNIRILTATDIFNIFLPNTSIQIENLDPGIQNCIESKERCTAYRIEH